METATDKEIEEAIRRLNKALNERIAANKNYVKAIDRNDRARKELQEAKSVINNLKLHG